MKRINMDIFCLIDRLDRLVNNAKTDEDYLVYIDNLNETMNISRIRYPHSVRICRCSDELYKVTFVGEEVELSRSVGIPEEGMNRLSNIWEELLELTGEETARRVMNSIDSMI